RRSRQARHSRRCQRKSTTSGTRVRLRRPKRSVFNTPGKVKLFKSTPLEEFVAGSILHVRLWHKADMPVVSLHVHFRGVKRTWLRDDAASVFDAKRTDYRPSYSRIALA